jgi:response regulator RpfG family c-di-GMP phosphodiesterase
MTHKAKKARILILDDDPAVCQLLGERLTLEGYDCITFTDVEEARTRLAAEDFDLIISDLYMPGRSGSDLLKEVRTLYPQLAFIMCTGEDDVRTGIESMKRGASDYLVKPLQLDAVAASVERALEKRRLQIELEQHRQHLKEMVDQRTRQLQTAIHRIEQTYDETLAALGGALELRDIETQGHSRRVTHYCLEIAQAMHCSSDEMRTIARGSFLHDIGKIGVPDAILLKPDRLTEEETALMQTHARIGYDLVCRIAFLTAAAQIVLTHQERYDGTGYPQGLRGEEIPLGARIFAVADTLDAMTSDRPYRAGLSFSAAHDEIARQSGRQFDPDVVQVFLTIPEQMWRKIRREATERPHFAISALAGTASRTAALDASFAPAGTSEEHLRKGMADS